MGFYAKFGKRAIDFTLSLFALLLLWPILLVLWILVRVNLGAPAIFRQERAGKDERPFTMYKFRTMTDARDEDGNLLPLNRMNFPEATSNALLKTFEEPPRKTTFIFLTKDKADVISTVVSRAQSFFVPSVNEEDYDYSLVEGVLGNYWTIARNDVLDFETNLLKLVSEHESKEIFTQIQNYILATIKSNLENKHLYYRLMEDLSYVEDAKRQISLTPAMNLQTVVENLCFKMILK